MKTVSDRLIAARSALITGQPFYGTLALHLELVERNDIPTAATDGKKIYYNPAFVDSLADDEIEFLLAHEAYHCANLHHVRRGNRDPKLWNIAADYVLNADLIQGRVGRMPAKGLYDPQYAGMAVEDLCRLLEQQGKAQQQPQQGKPGQGQEQGQKPGSGNGSQPGQPGGGPGATGDPSSLDAPTLVGAVG